MSGAPAWLLSGKCNDYFVVLINKAYQQYIILSYLLMLRFTQKKVSSLLTRSIFSKVEAKIENKMGILYLDSQKDYNALST